MGPLWDHLETPPGCWLGPAFPKHLLPWRGREPWQKGPKASDSHRQGHSLPKSPLSKGGVLRDT